VGASEYASWQLAHANLLAEVRGWTLFVVLQSRYNMLERQVEREVRPYCRAHGVGFIPYYPLAGGFLTGKEPEPGRTGRGQCAAGAGPIRAIAAVSLTHRTWPRG
jgi:aryl-alcohol dehydrogenase-like predicted oxidoreductase